MSGRGATVKLYDGAAAPGEWGHRPADGETCATNPPSFVWRPQGGAAAYELQCSRDPHFRSVEYHAEGMTYNCHCPPEPFEPGTWHWRFRYASKRGQASDWSAARRFAIRRDAAVFPMPPREELLGRIPKEHPRLFVRPEQLPELRKLASGRQQDIFAGLVEQCERLLADPPPTDEPPEYPDGIDRFAEEWRAIWWGSRAHTIRVLDGAATLAFTRLLGGKEEYGQLARRLLLEAAQWNPQGSTSFSYNDEAGMPYAYGFARAYTFLHDLLTEDDRALCQGVMTLRGQEIYAHLGRSHIWRPYGSHNNRAWHFLGEVGIAFLGEIPDAAEWVWFAANVFFNVWPVWSDEEGGWHEGSHYWASYVERFTWWGDVMRAALGIDACQKPYFSQVGYYPLYLQPPGTQGGGFGDLAPGRTSRDNAELMSLFAAQTCNPHWQWYVDAHGGAPRPSGYIGFLRARTVPGAVPVFAEAPNGLPTSRCFRDTGQAVLNTTLLNAKSNVQILFKSSPFGTQSHGYEAQNAFLLHAFGERLLIRSGRRDLYGSEHHRNWMWHTRSVNSITVNGESQGRRVATATGRIVAFHTSRVYDYVAGEAGGAYGRRLRQFTRHILFVKPHVVLILDCLVAPRPSSFEWHLHAPTAMDVRGPRDIRVVNGDAACRVAFLAPAALELSLTDQFDPPPHPRINLVEWHLTAQNPLPTEQMEFVTVIQPHRAGEEPPGEATLQELEGGYRVEAPLPSGRVVAQIRPARSAGMPNGAARPETEILVTRYDRAGRSIDGLSIKGERAVVLRDMSTFRLIPQPWESRLAAKEEEEPDWEI